MLRPKRNESRRPRRSCVAFRTRELSFKSGERFDDFWSLICPIAFANVDLAKNSCIDQASDRGVGRLERTANQGRGGVNGKEGAPGSTRRITSAADFARRGPSLFRHDLSSSATRSS